ncbi:MAG: hypothetical protein ABI432_14975 [Flavobacteriales bacterium]
MEQPSIPPPQTGEDKTVAIVAYITLIGFIIAIILHGQKKTALGAYHLRQALGLICAWFALWICTMILAVVTFGIGVILMPLMGILFLIAIIMGVVAAANGEMKPSFLFGKQYENWFKNMFN